MKIDFVLLRVGFLSLLLSAPAASAGGPIAYANSYLEDYISQFNPLTGKVTSLANAGIRGTSFAVSPDGRTAYVTTSYYLESTGLNVVDLGSGKITQSLNSLLCGNVALSPDGSVLYCAAGSTLDVVSTLSLNVISQVPLTAYGYPPRIVVNPDGATIYVAGTDGELYIISTQGYTVVATLPDGPISSITLSPDSKELYLLCSDPVTFEPVIDIIDATTNVITQTIPLPAAVGDLSNGGLYTAGIAISPDGRTLYMTSDKGLSLISTVTNSLVEHINTQGLTEQVTVSKDGRSVYLNRASELSPADTHVTLPGLLMFDVATSTITNVSLSGPAVSEQNSPSGNVVYVLQGAYEILAEDTSTQTITGRLHASGQAALSTSADGTTVAGLSYYQSAGPTAATISVVDTASQTVAGQFNYTPPGSMAATYHFSLALNSGGTLGYLAALIPAGTEPNTLVSVLSLPGGNLQQSFRFNLNNPEAPLFMQLSPDDSTLFTLASDWDYQGAFLCRSNLKALPVTTSCAALKVRNTTQQSAKSFVLSPDGASIYVPLSVSLGAGYSMGAFLLKINSSTLATTQVLTLQANSVNSIAYSVPANSIYLAVLPLHQATGGGIIRVDLATYTEMAIQPLENPPLGVAVTPDGTEVLATGSPSGTQVFDGMTLAPKGLIAAGQEQAIVMPAMHR